MKDNNSATALSVQPLHTGSAGTGLLWGLLGVTAFSFTVPLTRIAAETGTLSPLFIGAGRAAVASVLAGLLLLIAGRRTRRGGSSIRAHRSETSAADGSGVLPAQVPTLPRPSVSQSLRLLVVAGGVVLGFPLLTSFALTQTPASHGAVVIALLPAVTAAAAVLRTKERTSPLFWMLAGLSAVLAVVFAVVQGADLGGIQPADLLLFAAVCAAAIGYAEGGVLARELGAWQTISWALVLSAPVTLTLTIVAIVAQPPTGTVGQWASFAYLCVISMFLGFFAWYRGLAIGPMAQVSQIQLVQPVMSIAWAALLLGEHLDVPTLLCGTAVIASAALTVRTRLRS
ncbi:DMT family transporter [Brevibacterium sp. NPDC059310]|uniref:DMT family transporter n=1 Tax=Brevibacterium sp. NPDC059310 TaxID=3346802 RepID=UPI003670673F